MTEAKRALRLHRREIAFWNIANKWAAADEQAHPYWERNVHLYQNFACKDAAERSKLLIAYLARRQARA